MYKGNLSGNCFLDQVILLNLVSSLTVYGIVGCIYFFIGLSTLVEETYLHVDIKCGITQ